MEENSERRIHCPVIIGAGPAGLTAGWELRKYQINNFTIVDNDKQVGGISKTVEVDGWRFDLGGHRFFTKSTEVNQLWDEMLPETEFLIRPRKSRIFYAGKFYDYPLKPLNALSNLGLFETIRCVASYLYVRVRKPRNLDTFEGWVAARFGWRLYNIFFKTYTEKVWGISTSQLRSTWAAQRIKNLSLGRAILDAFGLGKKNQITSLIEEFRYPRLGPGQLWENVAKALVESGARIELGTSINYISRKENGYEIILNSGMEVSTSVIFSSIPLCEVPSLLDAPSDIKTAGQNLKHRDFLIVCIPVISSKEVFDDNWIYIHDPGVKVGRIQNYGQWSQDMVKGEGTCLGLEYFVNSGDSIWNKSDNDLVELAKIELATLGFDYKFVADSGYVVRVKNAYPVYDENYEENVSRIRNWLKTHHPNWFQIGRSAQHRYNNQDHSMLTAIRSVENWVLKKEQDSWNVNIGEYLEELPTREAPIFSN